MSRRRDWTGIAFAVLMLAAAADSRAALPAMTQDGWYRWETAAGSQGATACCYQWRHGSIGRAGCRLGGSGGLSLDVDCEVTSDRLQVFAEVRNGRVRDIRALSSACPVETSEPARDLGAVDTATSIGWLHGLMDDRAVREDAVLAISMHENAAAMRSLTALIENRHVDMELREQALFWLVQLPDDAVYRYFDRLLGAR